MKRFWIGIAVLLVLFAGGLAATAKMDQVHLGIHDTLQQAQTAALAEDWPAAQSLARQAYDSWLRNHHLTAAFADHTPMDELDSLFAELLVFSGQHEQLHFSATCAHLSELAASMAESHHISWWIFL